MRSVQLGLKRLFDITASVAILIVGAPLYLLLAVLVKLTSPEPVFFMQERLGWHEQPYKMIKFRTMTGQTDQDATRWTQAEETRITPIGSFLRDYGLDELPQAINILKGDMSVIGPRPPLPQQVVAFPPELHKMFGMRPGVLSLAAIEGRRSLPMEKRYELHVKYVETWSLKLDLKILWRSLFVVLGKESAQEKTAE
jgi:lipopolysaccharide/colanic/teichoic acid biosynthesis glycosyltransferase